MYELPRRHPAKAACCGTASSRVRPGAAARRNSVALPLACARTHEGSATIKGASLVPSCCRRARRLDLRLGLRASGLDRHACLQDGALVSWIVCRERPLQAPTSELRPCTLLIRSRSEDCGLLLRTKAYSLSLSYFINRVAPHCVNTLRILHAAYGRSRKSDVVSRGRSSAG